jgi:hypothetical protein
MAVTKYTEWNFNGIGGKAGRGEGMLLQLKINRGNYDYDWGVTHPTDSITCRDHKILDLGKYKQQRFDEDADLVLSDRSIVMKDVFFFGGIVNGSPTGVLDLWATQKTSRIPFIFSDPNIIYYGWLSQLNPDGSMKEIYMSCQFQIDLRTGTVVQVNKPMSSDESKLQRQKLVLTTMTDLLKLHMVEELVSGTNLNNPNFTNLSSRFVEADMADSVLTPWYNGLTLNENLPSGFAYGSLVTTNGNINPSLSLFYAPIIFDIAHYPCTNDGQSWVGSDFFDGSNVFTVNHGFRGISITTLLNKMGGVVGFDFAQSDADPVFASQTPSYDVSQGGFALNNVGAHPQTCTPFDLLYINYNVKFGVKPYIGTWITHDSPGGMDDVVSQSFTCSNTSPIVVTTASPHGIPNGATVNIEGVLGNTNANCGINGSVGYPTSTFNTMGVNPGHWVITYLTPTTFSLNGSTGNGADAGGNKFLHYMGKDWYQFTTPVTWARSMSFAQILSAICIDFGLLADFTIYQSGANKGKLKLILRNPLKSIGDIPLSWKDNMSTLLDSSSVQERILSKTNIKLKNLSSQMSVYCPSKLGESKELQIDGSAKKWGDLTRILANDMLIGDTNQDILHQGDTYYRFHDVESAGIDFNTRQNLMPMTTQGWMLAANYCALISSPSSNYAYPSVFDHIARGANGWDDWYGYITICYQDYMEDIYNHPGVAIGNFYNTIGAKAIFYANLFLLNTRIEKRGFNSIVDDNGMIGTLKPLLAHSWQDEFGNLVKYLIHSIEIDEE